MAAFAPAAALEPGASAAPGTNAVADEEPATPLRRSSSSSRSAHGLGSSLPLRPREGNRGRSCSRYWTDTDDEMRPVLEAIPRTLVTSVRYLGCCVAANSHVGRPPLNPVGTATRCIRLRVGGQLPVLKTAGPSSSSDGTRSVVSPSRPRSDGALGSALGGAT